MKDIFISYARHDRDWVEGFVQVLEREGLSVWWDRHIPPGKTFDEVIEEALDSARCVIVVWSHASVGSEWVKTEAAEGQRRGVLFPVLIDDSRTPLEFRRIQGAQLAQWDGSTDFPEFRLLLDSIRSMVGQGSGTDTAGGPAAGSGPASVPERGGWEAGTTPADRPHERNPEVTPPLQKTGREARTAPRPAPEPSAPPEPKRPSRRHLLRFLIGLVATLVVVAWVLYQQPPDFNPEQLRVGLLMRDNWIDADAQQVYGRFLTQLNGRLSEWGTGLAADPQVRLYRKPKEVIEALRRGEIELAGELSPRGIYRAETTSRAQPFVSPLYGGSHHYTAVFFVSAEYVRRHQLDPDAQEDVWQQVINDLADPEHHYAAAVSDPSSTSGYWYPRFELLRSLRGSKPFEAVTVERSSYKDLFAAVEHGYNGVIVGAIAKFRYCDPRYSGQESKEACKKVFIQLDDTSQIPQGGYVLREAPYRYLRSRNLLQKFQSAWKASVTATYRGASTAEAQALTQRYIPKAWGAVSARDYAKAREVFEFEDSAQTDPTEINQKLVITGIVIIVLVSLLVVWLRRPHPDQQPS